MPLSAIFTLTNCDRASMISLNSKNLFFARYTLPTMVRRNMLHIYVQSPIKRATKIANHLCTDARLRSRIGGTVNATNKNSLEAMFYVVRKISR